MWKYIVTYFVVVVTPIVKNSGDTEPEVIPGVKVPKHTFYVDVKADTTKNTQQWDNRNEAVQFIEYHNNYRITNYQEHKTMFILNLKLDSVKVKK